MLFANPILLHFCVFFRFLVANQKVPQRFPKVPQITVARDFLFSKKITTFLKKVFCEAHIFVLETWFPVKLTQMILALQGWFSVSQNRCGEPGEPPFTIPGEPGEPFETKKTWFVVEFSENVRRFCSEKIYISEI